MVSTFNIPDLKLFQYSVISSYTLQSSLYPIRLLILIADQSPGCRVESQE